MGGDIFFRDWQQVARTLAVGVPAYAILVLLLRVSGKRTLTKLNAFDLVVTVALGSTLASILTSNTLSLAAGVTALALLVFAQAAIAWVSVRWRGFQKVIKAQPALLYYDGEFLEDRLRRERVTAVEIEAAARSEGHASLEAVHAVVLETDGSISVLPRSDRGPQDLLAQVAGGPGGADRERLPERERPAPAKPGRAPER